MDRRRFLTNSALTLGLIAAPAIVRANSKRFDGITLRINGYGGDYDRILTEKVALPLERETGLKVVYTPSTSGGAVSRIIASPDDPPYDLVMCDSPNMPDLIAANALLPAELDSNVIGRLLPGVREFGDYGIPMSLASIILTQNTKLVKEPVTSYADLTRPDLKGYVGMFNLENSGGILQLLALADSNGGSADHIDPAFAALRKIKPNLVATTGSTVNLLQMLEREEARAGSFWDGRVFAMQKAGRPMSLVAPKEGIYALRSYVSPVRGTKHPDAVKAYLERILSPEYSVEMTSFFGYASLIKVDVPKEIAAKAINYGEGGLANLKKIDWAVVSQNRGDWLARFNREMA